VPRNSDHKGRVATICVHNPRWEGWWRRKRGCRTSRGFREVRRGAADIGRVRFYIAGGRVLILKTSHAFHQNSTKYLASTPCQAPFRPPEIPNPLSFVAPAQIVHTHLYGKIYFVRLLFAFCEVLQSEHQTKTRIGTKTPTRSSSFCTQRGPGSRSRRCPRASDTKPKACPNWLISRGMVEISQSSSRNFSPPSEFK
jgi:hypothetical protein